jgi:ATP-dependent DNA helicase RecG
VTIEELKIIIKEGESYKIEFKESLTSEIARELTAFANSAGGRIFLGISDNGNIKGIKITNSLLSNIQTIATNCDPPINIDIEVEGGDTTSFQVKNP